MASTSGPAVGVRALAKSLWLAAFSNWSEATGPMRSPSLQWLGGRYSLAWSTNERSYCRLVSETQLARHRELLKQQAEVFNVLVDPRVVPDPGSPAARELQDARGRLATAGLWGENPVRTAYAVAFMSYQAGLEQTRAMAELMTGAFTIVPVAALLRPLVEVASQAWWLLEPEIGAVARVARMQAVRYRSAVEGERVAKMMEVPENQVHLHTERVQQVADYSRGLGLDVPGKDGYAYVCAGERLPTPTYRVQQMFAEVDVPGVYNLYSGFTHGELFALWQAFEPGPRIDGHLHYFPAVAEEAFGGVVAVAAWTLYAAAARGIRLLGLDRAPLEDWIDEHDAVLHPETSTENGANQV